MVVEMRLNCTGAWTDYTSSVDVTAMRLNKSLDANNDPQKSQVGNIEVYGDSYQFIKANLIDSANLYSNSICVRITDTLCGSVQYTYKLENESLKWCDNGECRMDFSMVQYDEVYDCINQTLIADNTNGDFQDYPTSGNIHPRFRYCDVFKPTVVFGMLVTFMNMIDSVIASLNIVINTINASFAIINSILGTTISIQNINYVATSWGGCDRVHPAPYLRTYIDNVCTLCGTTMDIATNPILYTPAQYYYNTCLLTAYVTKGLRESSSKDYIDTNKPSWTLTTLLSNIKTFWNARWFINGTDIHFNRVDLIGEQIWGSTPAIDFSTGNDSEQLIGNVCYSWNGEGKLKRLNLSYTHDATDAVGNEMLKRFNGEYLDTSGNVNYKEDREVVLAEFSAPAFVADGQDTLYDANILNSLGIIFSQINLIGALKTTTDTIGMAKLLIYNDGTDIMDAKAINVSYTPYNGLPEFQNDVGPYFPVTSSDLVNANFPLSFSPDADTIIPNLWQYWQIEKPANGKKTNIAFDFKMSYCCTYNSLDLYQKVKFENGDEGEINYIDFDFANREITIKGNLK